MTRWDAIKTKFLLLSKGEKLIFAFIVSFIVSLLPAGFFAAFMVGEWSAGLLRMLRLSVTTSYVEAYINDEESKTLVFPIIELEELVFQKAVKEKYHIVCERGTQDGISRAMGNKVIDFKDMNNESMPAHKYDDDGIRRDGINPLTHSGYWEEEQ